MPDVFVRISWRTLAVWRPLFSGRVNYGMWRIPAGGSRWWLHAWTPVWHTGRGPYVSIGLGLVAVGRGY